MNRSTVKTWTDSKFTSFIMGVLRKGLSRFPNKYKALALAFTERRVNVKTGKLSKHYKCNICKGEFPTSEIQVDHINPIVPVEGFTNWDDVISRAFCAEEGYQVLCKECHSIKSKSENKERRENKCLQKVKK